MSMPRNHLWLLLALAACAEAPAPVEPEPDPSGIRLGTRFGDLPGRPFAVAVGTDGRIFVTIQDYRRVTGVGPERQAPRTSFNVGEVPADIVITPDGATAVVSSLLSGWLHFISTATGAPLDSMLVGTGAYRLALSADATDLFVTTTLGKVYRIIVATRQKADSAQLVGSLQGIARRGDGRIVVSSEDGEITVLDPATLAPITSRTLAGGAQDIAFSLDGTSLFVAQERTAAVAVLAGQSLETIEEINFEPEGRVAAFGLALSPDGRILVVTGTATSNVAVVDTETHEVLKVLGLSGGGPRRAAFALDGRTAYIAEEAGRLDVLRIP